MTLDPTCRVDATTSYKNAPTRIIAAGGADFAYRELGQATGTPVVFLTRAFQVVKREIGDRQPDTGRRGMS